MMLAAISSLSITANAAEEPSFFKDVAFSGHLDVYYQYDFGKPATGTAFPNFARGVNFRQFDVAHNTFSLAALQFNVARKPTAESPYGLTLSFAAGKNTDIIHSGEPAGAETYKHLQQAYVSYAPGPFTVDFGKFLTWIGYEGIVSADNDNYSRSFLFYFCQPIYHAGIRASAPLGASGVTASAYLVNGWNETEDSNAGKSYGATLGGTLGRTAITANYYGGNEGGQAVGGGAFSPNGFFSNGVANVQLADLVVVHPLTSRLKLALNADYGSAKPVSAGDVNAGHGKFYGIAGYLKSQFNDRMSGAIRYESVSDPDGARGGAGGRFNSLTGTLDFAPTTNSLFRVELRFDRSNRNVFNSDDAGGTTDSRTTLSVSHVLRF
jgi:hypothetical protein